MAVNYPADRVFNGDSLHRASIRSRTNSAHLPALRPCLPTNEHQRQPVRAWRVRDQQIPSDAGPFTTIACKWHPSPSLGRKQVARPGVVTQSTECTGAPCRRTHMRSVRACATPEYGCPDLVPGRRSRPAPGGSNFVHMRDCGGWVAIQRHPRQGTVATVRRLSPLICARSK